MEREGRITNWLSSMGVDCRFAFRQFRKSPGFTTVAILTLALGVGANTAIFSICSAALIRPLPYPHPERLVKANVYDLKSGEAYGETSYPDFRDWSDENQSFDSLAAYEPKTFNLSKAKEPENVKGEVVSADFFETLGIQPFLGRSFSGERNQQAVVLSHALWSRSFNSDPGVIGKPIALDGYSYEVVGVMPQGFQFPDTEAELWTLITPVRPDLREEITARGNLGFSVVGRLTTNATLSQAQAGMTAIASGLEAKYPEADRDLGVRLVSLQEDMVGKFRPALLILMCSAALVLLIACANIGTLLLARAASRESEIAIRSSLGASRKRILAQFLTENLLLALIGGAFGALLAYPLMKVIRVWAPGDIPGISSARIDLPVFVFAALIAVLTGIFFGLAPAWQSSFRNLDASLKKGGRSLEARNRLTQILVVGEIALALILLAAAGLLGKSLFLLSQVDPGFRTDHLLTVEIYRSMSDDNRETNWKNWTGFYQQLLARIQALPGVEAAGATLALPIHGRVWNISFKIEGRPFGRPSQQPQADSRIVSNDYFDVMKIPLRTGRYFSEHDAKDTTHVAIINEALARQYWPNENPVGRFIEMGAFGGGRCEIVGVVGDIRQTNLSDAPAAGIYVPYTQEIMPWQTLVIRTRNDPMAIAAQIRHEVAALDPEQPVARVATMDQLKAMSTALPRFRTFLLGSFAGVAMLLATIGIYGVMAYTVSRRTNEIGIRMAMGAEPANILRLIVGESMTLALVGASLGLGGAYAVTRVMKGLLFGVTSTDPLTFAGVTFLLCLAALFAAYVPAHRASRVDPLVAIKYE